MERRLAAILAADMVGYSRLMAADEAGTIERQKAHRAALIDPKIAQFGGHIVKTTGDGVLVEFPSVVDAVQCALEIQHMMPERESAVQGDRRIHYRIGINLGDIVFDEEDIFGDGVNIASRLEGISDAGGICISDVVYQNVQGRLSEEFRDQGEVSLKNIGRPLRVWKWNNVAVKGEGLTPKAAKVASPSTKTSIAVLPFVNMSADPEQDYFADGITEDIITELTRFRSLFVVARQTTFALKGSIAPVAEIGHQLGVAYLVQGSVRKLGDDLRITAQLVEAASGSHVWAERFDRKLKDIFDVQDEVVASIVAKLELSLNEEATARATQATAEAVTAYDFLLKGRAAWWRGQVSEGFHLVELAVAADPGFAPAHAWLALQYAYQAFSNTTGLSAAEIGPKARQHAETALELDDRDPFVHMAASMAFGFTPGGSKERGFRHIEIAHRLNPHDCDVMFCRAYHLSFLGRHGEAVDILGKLQDLNPASEYMVSECLTDTYFMMKDYGKCLETFRGQGQAPPQVLVVFAACHSLLGDEARARACLAEMERIKSASFDPSEFAKAQIAVCARGEDAAHWREAFGSIGLNC